MVSGAVIASFEKRRIMMSADSRPTPPATSSANCETETSPVAVTSFTARLTTRMNSLGAGTS